MRIANICSVFPPRFVGGYELGCADVLESLREKGHEICVLTGDGPPDKFQPSSNDEPSYVHRCLPLVTWGSVPPDQLRDEEISIRLNRRASRVATAMLADFKPDLTIFWCVARLPKSVIFQVQRGFRTGFYISDHWLAKSDVRPLFTYLAESDNSRYRNAKRSVLKQLAGANYHELDLRMTIFASEHLKDEALRKGFSVSNAKIIHWGIRQDRFPNKTSRTTRDRLDFVYAGQLSEHKGPDTLISSFKEILNENPRAALSLTIYGGATGVGAHDYERTLHELAKPWEANGKIRFAGKVSRAILLDQLFEYDAFVLPSRWEEPFSISLLEAMSSGLAVIATLTGGTREILNNHNALIFEPGNTRQLKDRILSLLNSPTAVSKLQDQSLVSVAPYTLEKMVDEFETVIEKWHVKWFR